ncbi:polysaccharide deacetylase family protein [Deinococcus sp. HMF7604]|uniref:polysaccharide deacetylase family protein n=1 Tax=Deinococcus betulae TaxID=2873312 RepID=UPI001CCAF088|nr:polysaccharide deacetylase family protein [Deinococcus betulae]MBZ9753315.1 polysaccharide deacetylase family protein [Deinococcus betulae]
MRRWRALLAAGAVLLLGLTPVARTGAPTPATLDLVGPVAQQRLHLSAAASLHLRSNGFVSMAFVALTIRHTPGSMKAEEALAVQAVNAAYQAFPDLAEVDVALFEAGQYLGFASRAAPPLLTLSVPAQQRPIFAWALRRGTYPRVWPASTPDLMAPAPIAPLPTRRPIWRGAGTTQDAALTLDDAPHPLYTPLLLDLLRRYGVPATFFVIGQNAEHYPYFVRDMVKAGHQVGNHTYSHALLKTLTAGEVRSELARTSGLLRHLTGQDITAFRPPGGGLNAAVLGAAAAQGLRTVMWSHDAGDYLKADAQSLQKAFAHHLHPGQITLLHDKVDSTLGALPAMIQAAQARGYALRTVDGLLSPEPARRLAAHQPAPAAP